MRVFVHIVECPRIARFERGDLPFEFLPFHTSPYLYNNFPARFVGKIGKIIKKKFRHEYTVSAPVCQLSAKCKQPPENVVYYTR